MFSEFGRDNREVIHPGVAQLPTETGYYPIACKTPFADQNMPKQIFDPFKCFPMSLTPLPSYRSYVLVAVAVVLHLQGWMETDSMS